MTQSAWQSVIVWEFAKNGDPDCHKKRSCCGRLGQRTAYCRRRTLPNSARRRQYKSEVSCLGGGGAATTAGHQLRDGPCARSVMTGESAQLSRKSKLAHSRTNLKHPAELIARQRCQKSASNPGADEHAAVLLKQRVPAHARRLAHVANRTIG